MNLEELRLKFWPDTPWHQTNRCGWCEEVLIITEARYKAKGNICEQCNLKINKTMWELKNQNIRMIELQIKELRKEMEYLGEKLELELNEEGRQWIVGQMESMFAEIKQLERRLC